ncbi:hypothetical protein Ddye_028320 [Dipteronia dyeriana]|uniref:RING-type E3 ubiquitin transferase n=1 Tax=Dipteronia dyeriana TaxID=168575 RepID=A0AAD9TRN4_9ROSI|nr:hypothetical protein Ddye_028320 [Dipteronia dyeriana]
MKFSSKHGTLLLLLLLPFSSGQSQPSPDRYDPYAQATFSPSMAIIIVILIAALFFMGFFSVYIRHCSNDPTGAAVRPLNGSLRSRRAAAARGLDIAIIEKFPTLVYSEVKVLKIGKGALECAVCLCEFEDDETLRLIPKCDHVFHPECIDAWLSSHTTCPVCRANLSPQLGGESDSPLHELDVEAQNDAVEPEHLHHVDDDVDGETDAQPSEAEVIDMMNRTLNRNRTRGSRSNRPRKFPRSHSTGHSLVQPGENTERFTLRLPVDVRKQVMNRKLNRANSLVVLPREGSSRRGYRNGGEGSSRGKSSRWLERMDRSFKSDRWVFSKAPPFFSRATSFQSSKVAANDVNEPPVQESRPEGSLGEPGRPPV